MKGKMEVHGLYSKEGSTLGTVVAHFKPEIGIEKGHVTHDVTYSLVYEPHPRYAIRLVRVLLQLHALFVK